MKLYGRILVNIDYHYAGVLTKKKLFQFFAFKEK